MGIYIKGMEMPKSCDECRIMMFEDTNCLPELFCGCPIVFKAHPQGVGHRPDYCPLIEVPLHGRLIDIEPLMRGLYEEIQMGQITYTSQEIYDMMDNEIKSIPTIIPAEEGEMDKQGCPPDYNGGFCADYNVDCKACWEQWEQEHKAEESE